MTVPDFDIGPFLEKRKKLVDIYRTELDGLPLDYIEEEDGKVPAYYRFVV